MSLAATAWMLRERLAMVCQQVAIAGSIRRGKAQPKDIEIVTLPAWSTDLFGEPMDHGLVEWVWENLEPRGWRIVKGGGPDARYLQLIGPRDEQLDLFIARPDNYGLILMIRTGPAEFSHAMATRANQLGMHFHDGRLCGGFTGRARGFGGTPTCSGFAPIPTPKERGVFEVLRVRWVEPEKRVGPADLRSAGVPL